MKIFKDLIEKAIITSKTLLTSTFYRPSERLILHKDIPYYSQWESKELVDKILFEKMKASDDPLWKKSGAKTKEEYIVWSWSGCGMACLKMILAHRINKEYPLVDLGKQCMAFGGYTDNSSKYDTQKLLSQGKPIPSEYLGGLFYKPFLQYIKSEFKLNGRLVKYMVVDDIVMALASENYVIASVNSSIRNPDLTPKKKGGHLVLVTGFDLNQRLLYIHNPSGFFHKSQEHFPITFRDFNRFFANRGVVVYQK